MIELPKWASKITFDMLPDAHKKFAEEIGVEATLRLCTAVGGSNPYIPIIDTVYAVTRDKLMIEAFSQGTTVPVLAREYGITERAVQRIVKKRR